MIIGVDIGGTGIRAGLIDNGNVLAVESLQLEDKENLEATLNQLSGLVRTLFNENVTGIGIGVPSVVDVERGIVYDVVNIPSWEKVFLKDFMVEQFGVDVAINNDVNCFVLGEQKFGAAKNYDSVVGITIGSGLGAGLILDEKLYMGANCGAGEIGMLPYKDSYLEKYVGRDFFLEHTGKEGHQLMQEATSGSADAKLVWDEFGRHLGNAILAIMYIYDPEMIIIGGSISKAAPLFLEKMFEEIQAFAFKESLQKIKIEISDTEHVAILGAASLCLVKEKM